MIRRYWTGATYRVASVICVRARSAQGPRENCHPIYLLLPDVRPVPDIDEKLLKVRWKNVHFKRAAVQRAAVRSLHSPVQVRSSTTGRCNVFALPQTLFVSCALVSRPGNAHPSPGTQNGSGMSRFDSLGWPNTLSFQIL